MSSTRRFIPASEWQDERHVFGLEGERIAIAYLTACGWMVEAHRFKLGRHEIDLVVRRDRTVAFVEVKARRSNSRGSGLEAVGWKKQRDIARVATAWRLRYGRPDDEYRFDVLSLQQPVGGKAGPVVEHVPDAWRPRSAWSDGR